MAYSIQTAVSDGTLAVLDLSIKYMDKSHIQVYVDDVLADGTAYSYVWLTDTRIQVVPAVANGSTLKVIRKTLTDEMWHEFTQGARFSTTSMDENFEQLLFLAQEYSEGIYVSDFYTDLDMHLHRLINLADPVSENDAVNLKTLRDFLPYGEAVAGLVTRVTSLEQGLQPIHNIITTFNATGYGNNAYIYFSGHSVAGDGGGGYLRYLANSSLTANGLTIYTPAVGGGRLVREGWSIYGINPQWAGVKNDGTPCSVELQRVFDAANALTPKTPVKFPAGDFNVTATVNARDLPIYGLDRQLSRVLCNVPTGSLTFSNVGQVLQDIGFKDTRGAGAGDGIGIKGYKNYIIKCFFEGLNSPVCPTDIIVTSVVDQCEFLSCDSVINDKLHDKSSAHTTLYFTNNNVLYCTKAFQLETEASGFQIVGNVFEDLAWIYSSNGKQISGSLFEGNWVEQMSRSCTLFYQTYSGGTNVFHQNNLRPGAYSITDAAKWSSAQFALAGDAQGGGGGVSTDSNGARVTDFLGNGLLLTHQGIKPSAAKANFSAATSLTLETQDANSNQDSKGGDFILSLGRGEGMRSGLVWGLPKDGSDCKIMGRAALPSTGENMGLTLGSTSYYYGKSDNLSYMHSYIQVGGEFTTAGDGVAAGVVDLYAGGFSNGGAVGRAPSLVLRAGHRNGSFAVYPGTDNQVTIGTADRRPSVIYSATGTINTSDERTKTDIAPTDLGLDFIRALNPVSYRFKVGSVDTVDSDTEFEEVEEHVLEEVDGKMQPVYDEVPEYDSAGIQVGSSRVQRTHIGKRPKRITVEREGSRTHYGLIAQQVKQVVDSAGCKDFAGWTIADKNNPESQQGLRYDQFISPLIAAVQELAAKVDELQRKLDEYE